MLGTFEDKGTSISFTTAVRKLPVVSYHARHLEPAEVSHILNMGNESGTATARRGSGARCRCSPARSRASRRRRWPVRRCAGRLRRADAGGRWPGARRRTIASLRDRRRRKRTSSCVPAEGQSWMAENCGSATCSAISGGSVSPGKAMEKWRSSRSSVIEPRVCAAAGRAAASRPKRTRIISSHTSKPRLCGAPANCEAKRVDVISVSSRARREASGRPTGSAAREQQRQALLQDAAAAAMVPALSPHGTV